jgi:hypothetical protein
MLSEGLLLGYFSFSRSSSVFFPSFWLDRIISLLWHYIPSCISFVDDGDDKDEEEEVEKEKEREREREKQERLFVGEGEKNRYCCRFFCFLRDCYGTIEERDLAFV